MSKVDSAGLQGSATDESIDAEERGLKRVNVALPDDTVQALVEKTRSLSPDDSRVTFRNELMPRIGQQSISSILFEAECIRSHHKLRLEGEEPETLHVDLYYAPITFEGRGQGYLIIDITADADTHEIEALSFTAQLSAEAASTDRPDGCQCGDWNRGDELACWPCFSEGFEASCEQ